MVIHYAFGLSTTTGTHHGRGRVTVDDEGDMARVTWRGVTTTGETLTFTTTIAGADLDALTTSLDGARPVEGRVVA